MTDKTNQKTELLVCVKCKRGTEVTEDGERPGQRLFDDLSARVMPEGVALRAVECLQNCDYGCSVALRGGPGRWTYVYGNFHEDEHGALLLEAAALPNRLHHAYRQAEAEDRTLADVERELYGHAHPDRGPLAPRDFSGGVQGAVLVGLADQPQRDIVTAPLVLGL